MRFVHTADWHLGKKLLGYERLEEQARFIDELVDFVERESVDALLLAGDIFDRSVPPVDALELFGDFLLRMSAAACPLVAISGNHDSPERLGFTQALLETSGVYLRTRVTQAFEPITLGNLPLEVFALPFSDPHALASEVSARTEQELEQTVFREHGAAVEAYVRSLPPRTSQPRVLLAHLFCIGGVETPDSERPISNGGAGHVSPAVLDAFDYVALGHLHRPQRVAGREHIRYAGSPLQYSVSEHSHKKSVTLVELEPDAAGAATVHTEPVALHAGRKVVVLKDRFDALMNAPQHEAHRDAFVAAYYTDETYVLNAATRLQDRFPFLVQALPSRVVAAAELTESRASADSPRELLNAFWSYAQVEHELEEAHHAHYARTLERVQAPAEPADDGSSAVPTEAELR